MKIFHSIQVSIPVEFTHQIHFCREIFRSNQSLLRDLLISKRKPSGVKVLAILDGDLSRSQPKLIPSIIQYFAAHSPVLKLVCHPVEIFGGEQAKNTDLHVKNIYTLIERHGMCRHSYVMAVGGGALLDVVGFATATAHRGLRIVRIPTTVLAQADAGVGVKNGINYFGKKNFIGTFAPPFAVINDLNMLESLSDRDKRSGFIEAVKVALIRKQSFFNFIEKNALKLRQGHPGSMEKLVRECAELHVQHIAKGGDPFENGSSRPLDFGHWSAHKIEQLSQFRINHGEAVAMGISLDVIYSNLMGFLDSKSMTRILDTIEALGYELYTREFDQKDSQGKLLVLKGLNEFREHLGGELTVTMLKGIGKGFEIHEIDEKKVREALHILKDRSKTSLPKPGIAA